MPASHPKRRAVLAGLSASVALLPGRLSAQGPTVPVVGFLNGQSPDRFRHLADAFVEGLAAAGYVDRLNVAIDYRWAYADLDALPGLARELARREVSVIFVGGGEDIAFAAVRGVATTIPVVFVTGGDPVALGLVDTMPRPGGNITGVVFSALDLEQKRLEILHHLLPAAANVHVLIDPSFALQRAVVDLLIDAATALGLTLRFVPASTPAAIDAAFAALEGERAEVLLIGGNGFFVSRRDQVVALAAQYRIPTVYTQREYAVAGGLISYGTSIAFAYRMAGNYVGRILGGAVPAELPVAQTSAFELVINLRTAAELGITVPIDLLAVATEFVE